MQELSTHLSNMRGGTVKRKEEKNANSMLGVSMYDGLGETRRKVDRLGVVCSLFWRAYHPPPPLPVPRLGSIVAVPASRLGEMMGYFGVGHGHSTPSYILIGPPSLFALPALEKKCLGN